MNYEPKIERVSALSSALGKHIAIYDLEATTFRGRPNFGITEVACLVVAPAGPGVFFSALINPERSISPEAQALNGITPALVSDKETWGARYAGLFKRIAEGQCWLAGFNNSTFDNPAVKDMNLRYGHPIESFAHTFDIRRLHLKLSAAKKQAGTLEVVAASYGVRPSGALHRAGADVVLTLELLDALLRTYGQAAVLALIQEKPAGAPDQLHAKAVAKYVKAKKKNVDLDALASAFKADRAAMSFEVGKGLDERLFTPDLFRSDEVQGWLTGALSKVDEKVFQTGRLKPVFEALIPLGAPAEFDYIQLRIGLLATNRTWASLKPQ